MNPSRGELIAAAGLGITMAVGIATVAQWKGSTETAIQQHAHEMEVLDHRITSLELDARHRQ